MPLAPRTPKPRKTWAHAPKSSANIPLPTMRDKGPNSQQIGSPPDAQDTVSQMSPPVYPPSYPAQRAIPVHGVQYPVSSHDQQHAHPPPAYVPQYQQTLYGIPGYCAGPQPHPPSVDPDWPGFSCPAPQCNVVFIPSSCNLSYCAHTYKVLMVCSSCHSNRLPSCEWCHSTSVAPVNTDSKLGPQLRCLKCGKYTQLHHFCSLCNSKHAYLCYAVGVIGAVCGLGTASKNMLCAVHDAFLEAPVSGAELARELLWSGVDVQQFLKERVDVRLALDKLNQSVTRDASIASAWTDCNSNGKRDDGGVAGRLLIDKATQGLRVVHGARYRSHHAAAGAWDHQHKNGQLDGKDEAAISPHHRQDGRESQSYSAGEPVGLHAAGTQWKRKAAHDLQHVVEGMSGNVPPCEGKRGALPKRLKGKVEGKAQTPPDETAPSSHAPFLGEIQPLRSFYRPSHHTSEHPSQHPSQGPSHQCS
jgi:hypothetical protein